MPPTSDGFQGDANALTHDTSLTASSARAAGREVIRRLGITEDSTPEEKQAAKVVLQQLGLASDTGKAYVRTTSRRTDGRRPDFERTGILEG